MKERYATEKEAKIKILGKVFMYTVRFFHDSGFTQLMPVMLGKSVDPLGPDPGSSVVKIPEIEYQGEKLRLTTSMILHKQVAVKGIGRIFIMSPNIRLERAERKESGRHLFEFTQADFEMSGAKKDDVFGLLEDYYRGLSEFLAREASEEFEALGIGIFEFKPPFKRYTTHELFDKYGEDWERQASLAHDQPFWAICYKREFYDKEDPKEEGHFLNYDLIYPEGFGEGISGAEREHEFEVIHRKIKRDKLDLSPYATYLKFAKAGLIPSAGAGIGMERLARFLSKSKHISEVTLFRRVPGMPVDI
ncbi:hypothetical protein A3K63_01270 [Candidatus Micrarchaeota archaeon RBG_16_49_10]|nr:MAG: hypothetical protein A3K63_01270 [Candidatus Micrarchaeota archaeon RBG_16_49_10]